MFLFYTPQGYRKGTFVWNGLILEVNLGDGPLGIWLNIREADLVSSSNDGAF